MNPSSSAAFLDQFELAHLDLRAHLVWAVLLLILVSAWAARRRRRALDAFGVTQEDSRRVGKRRAFAQGLLALALLALLGAALGPRANPQRRVVETEARDLAICLDVSRSMQADDLKPSRLEHAKLELNRLADHLGSERVGLVLFAGEAVIRCPLTSNTSYFQTAIRNVGPGSVSQGGTHIGDAIRKALSDLLGHDLSSRSSSADATESAPDSAATSSPAELSIEELESYQDILVITDGEDHESYPVHAARLARQLGVGVFAVGLGSPEGRLIPLQGLDGGYVEYKGAPVKSALDESLLTEMVNAAGRGRYLPVGTQHFDLVDFYENTIKKGDGRVTEEEHLVWTEVYQPFLILGLILLFLSRAIPLGRARSASLSSFPVAVGAPAARAPAVAAPLRSLEPRPRRPPSPPRRRSARATRPSRPVTWRARCGPTNRTRPPRSRARRRAPPRSSVDSTPPSRCARSDTTTARSSTWRPSRCRARAGS
jgi:Ca-activated chloride channel family protein